MSLIGHPKCLIPLVSANPAVRDMAIYSDRQHGFFFFFPFSDNNQLLDYSVAFRGDQLKKEGGGTIHLADWTFNVVAIEKKERQTDRDRQTYFLTLLGVMDALDTSVSSVVASMAAMQRAFRSLIVLGLQE